jgi:hypothetical protein
MQESYANTEKPQRKLWLRSGIAAVVVLGLFIGIRCIHQWPFSKSHPISRQTTLRSSPAQTFAPSNAVVQGAPINAPKPSGEQPLMFPGPSAALPSVPFKKLPATIGEYTVIGFDLLGGPKLEEPDWNRMNDPQYASSVNLDVQIPDEIKAFNGKPVAIQGFMLPADVEKGKIRSFFLLKDQMMCCFGVIPRINDWVYVHVDEAKQIRDYPDTPVTVLGTLRVGQEFENGVLLGVYHMQIDEMRTEM